MSVKSITKKSPRAMPVETIITRYKSAQQKLKIDKEPTKVTTKSKLKQKSKCKLKTKLQKKQVKEIEKKRKKKEEEPPREFYPEKPKRKTLNKKIVLMPKHCLTIIGGTNGSNKRKMHIPQKGVTKRARQNSRSSTPSELDADSPKHKAQELSIKEMVLLIEEQGGLDEEDLLEILTCPSPVWWEDPPAGYVEDPILTRPRSVERKSVKNQLIEEQIREAERKKKTEANAKSEAEASTNVSDINTKNLGITSLDVSVRNRDVNFMNKRCKLESLLGSIKNKVNKYCDNTQRHNDVKIKSSTTSRRKKESRKTDKINVARIDTIKGVEGDVEGNSIKKRNSDSFEEDSILHLDDEGILSLENINIPIAPNGMLDDKIETAVVKTVTNVCRKEESNKSSSDGYHKCITGSKSLLRTEYNHKNKRNKKETPPVKIKIPISTKRVKVRANDKNKNVKINALPIKIENNISNNAVSKIKEPYIKNGDNSKNTTLNEVDRTLIKVEGQISKNTVNSMEQCPKIIKNKSSKDCEIEKSFIKIEDTSVSDTLREIKGIPVKLEDTSEDNIRDTEKVIVKSENNISNNNTVRENETFMDINDISKHNLSEIKDTEIKINDNISQSVIGIDKSIEIINVLSDEESDIDASLGKLKNTNQIKDSIKKEYKNDTRRVSVDSDVSDRNMSEEYLDMSVFDDEYHKTEVSYNQNSVYTEISQPDMKKIPNFHSRSFNRPTKFDKPLNINKEPNTDAQNIPDEIDKPNFHEINNIYNEREYIEDEKRDFSENPTIDKNLDIDKRPTATEHKSPEYIEVYKIINSDSDVEMNLIKHKDKDNDGADKIETFKEKLDKPLNFYYKQRKVKNNSNKKDGKIKEMKVDGNCDCNIENKSVLVSDNDGVKYCLICSSIFDTESCKYCIAKLKSRCSCANRSQYECNFCNVIMSSKEDIIRHINSHKFD